MDLSNLKYLVVWHDMVCAAFADSKCATAYANAIYRKKPKGDASPVEVHHYRRGFKVVSLQPKNPIS